MGLYTAGLYKTPDDIFMAMPNISSLQYRIVKLDVKEILSFVTKVELIS
jgi:hypothetical protein